ncbi:CD209 [Branchiostoma lanceolatum]|uniref:CD209 protein n=1 Tax=Branchiostoma lanceolatum TaxID=7740 RepID=A0A8K0A5V5_BRALA|nr:CD209 [Branchiostoma lanceolatum]
MTATEGPCPPGYHLFQDNCYKVFEDTLKYEGSVETCRKDGGILATPRDCTTDQFLIELKNRVSENRYVRIGLTDRLQEGVFVWSDGSPLRERDYTAWTQKPCQDVDKTGRQREKETREF